MAMPGFVFVLLHTQMMIINNTTSLNYSFVRSMKDGYFFLSTNGEITVTSLSRKKNRKSGGATERLIGVGRGVGLGGRVGVLLGLVLVGLVLVALRDIVDVVALHLLLLGRTLLVLGLGSSSGVVVHGGGLGLVWFG